MDQPHVLRIQAFSRWVGLADPCSHSEKFEAILSGGAFEVVEPKQSKGKRFDARLGTAMLAALEKPPVSQLDHRLLGLPEELVQEHYKVTWTDDYPQILVRLILNNGRRISASSDVQQRFMLPWTVDENNGTRRVTFNPSISRILARMLPDGFLNRERIRGWGLVEEALFLRRAQESIEEEPAPPHEDKSKTTEAVDLPIIELPEEIIHATVASLFEDDPDYIEIGRPVLNPDVLASNSIGETSLMRVAKPPGNMQLFDILVRTHADVNARRRDGATGLLIAASGGEIRMLAAWIKAGANVNIPDYANRTPLMCGASETASVKLLLDAGAAVNAVDKANATALMYAVIGRHWTREQRKIEAVKMMLAAGAEVTVRDKSGRTALTYALEYAERIRIETEVQRELCPSKADELDTEFELSHDEDGKEQVLYFPKTDGTELWRVLESAGCKP